MCEQIALKPAPAHSRDFSRELAGAFLMLSGQYNYHMI